MSEEAAGQWLENYSIIDIEGRPSRLWLRMQSAEGGYARMDIYPDLFTCVDWRKQTIAQEETQRGEAWTSLSQQARAQMLESFWAWWNALTQAEQADWGNEQSLENTERSGGNAWMTEEGQDEDETAMGEQAEEGNGVEVSLAVAVEEVVGAEHEEEKDADPSPGPACAGRGLVKMWSPGIGVQNVIALLLKLQSHPLCYTNYDRATDATFVELRDMGMTFNGVALSAASSLKNLWLQARRIAGAGTWVKHVWQPPSISFEFKKPAVPKNALKAVLDSKIGEEGGLHNIVWNIFEGLLRPDGAGQKRKAATGGGKKGYKQYEKDENLEGRLAMDKAMKMNSAQVALPSPPLMPSTPNPDSPNH